MDSLFLEKIVIMLKTKKWIIFRAHARSNPQFWSIFWSNFGWNYLIIGGTQTLFRDLPKFSNIGKIFRSSCLTSEIGPSHEIWAHGPVPGPKNRIRHFEVWDWEKYPLKLVFWKTLGAIVISVERSSTSPKVMEK